MNRVEGFMKTAREQGDTSQVAESGLEQFIEWPFGPLKATAEMPSAFGIQSYWNLK